MTLEDARRIRGLLADTPVLSLAVLVDGAPVVGLLPFAVAPGLGAAYVHASRLARHTRGLLAGAPFGVLVHAAPGPGGDPLQVPRLSLEGTVEPLADGSAEHAAARELYLRRFPGSAPTFELGDFTLHALRFRGGRFVRGFAQALNLTEDTLRKVAALA
jgi:hypothetical protein